MRLIVKHYLDILAVGGSVVGSMLVASNLGLAVFGYVFFLIGSTASVAVLRKSNVNKSMIWLNIYYMAVNCFGLLRFSFS